MSLTQGQITHLTKLTALNGGSVDISSVIDSFEALGNIDTKSIVNVGRSGKWSLDLRPDTVVADMSIADKLLACSNQKKAAHQIVLSGIMQGE
jgi:Asp-tRNA(Asn)/Glu-tRNA(Gln) amidotransferase C subunit